MKKITDFLLVVVMLFALQSCSNDDEPNQIDPAHILGEWYMTNIRGWEYDSKNQNKSEFNETFNFNGQGIPVGGNIIDAQKIRISQDSFDSETDTYFLTITSFYWDIYTQDWVFNESGTVKLKGNQLIDGTLKVSITELTDDSMNTYQKDEDGETYVTYNKLS